MKAKPWKHLYNRAAWKRMRLVQLRKQPLCAMCEQSGKVKAADVVDHVVPHKGDEALFFDSSNLASMCKFCHDSVKQKQEKSGTLVGHDANGWPLDENHWWNKKQ